MKIAIFTRGTLGDVRPYLALALGLQDLGHQAVLAAPENFASYVKQFGIPYHSLTGDTQKILESEQGRKWMAAGNAKQFMKALNQISQQTRYELQSDILAACRYSDAMIFHPLLTYHAAVVSELLQKPFMMAYPFPLFPATTAFPQMLVRAKRFPIGLLNLLTHRLYAKAYEKGMQDNMDEWRAKLSLPPHRGSLYANMHRQRILNLHAYSPTLVPHPKDWGDNNFITGAWKIDGKHLPQHTPQPPDELVQWLENGPAPIYFGFGSLPVLEPQKMIEMVVDIAKSLQARAIIASGWSGMTFAGNDLPESIFMIDSVDHEWLFPRCSCVIHHGGAGTTHTALESGTPSIICSTYADQPFWGETIADLNIGRHIPFSTLSQAKLTQAIRELQSESVKARAAETGTRMKAENGLQNALDRVEKHLPAAPIYKGGN